MRKIIFILLPMLVLFASLGYADTKPTNGVYHWNLTGLTDYWRGTTLTNSGAVSVNAYPTYITSGTSSPNSYDFEWDEVDYLVGSGVGLKGCADGSCAFTFNGWYYFESFPVVQYLFMTHNSAATKLWRFYTYYDDNLYLGDGMSAATGQLSWTTGRWYMVTGTCDEATNTANIYINATLVGTGTATNCQNHFDIAENNMYYSRQSNINQRGVDGYIDEMSWYNISLTTTQISNLYNYGTISSPFLSIINDYNITSNNIFGSRIGWQTSKKNVNVTSNLLTGTFSTNINSNCTISKYNQNYDQMFANWSSTKLATTNTVSHSFTYPYNLTNGTQCVYIACKSTSGSSYANSSCLNVTRILTARFIPPLTTQTTSAGAQKNYTVGCIGYPTTMTYSSNISTAIAGSTISSSTGFMQIYPSYLHIGNRTISVTCNNGYQANTSTFNLIVGPATGGGTTPSCTQYLQTDYKTGLQINYNLTVSCFNPDTSTKSITITPPTGYGGAVNVSLTASASTYHSFYKNESRGTSDADIAEIAGSNITGDLVMTTNEIKNFIPIDPPYAWTKDGIVDCNMSMHSYVPLSIPYNLTFRNAGTFIINSSLSVKGFYKPDICTIYIKPPGQLYIG